MNIQNKIFLKQSLAIGSMPLFLPICHSYYIDRIYIKVFRLRSRLKNLKHQPVFLFALMSRIFESTFLSAVLLMLLKIRIKGLNTFSAYNTGCSLNIVFLEDFKIFRTLAFLCFFSVSVCVHTPGR